MERQRGEWSSSTHGCVGQLMKWGESGFLQEVTSKENAELDPVIRL